MFVLGIDPGNAGSIAIINTESKSTSIFKMPLIINEKKVKGKIKVSKSYDVLKIREILKDNLSEKDLFYVEKVQNMPGEGSTSSFNFGKGIGILEGLIVGIFNINPIFVSPIVWKKYFEKDLITDEMIEIKNKIKELKEKDDQKLNKKEVEKLGRLFKNRAKSSSRMLATKKFPEFSKILEKKGNDGIAESLLIALYGLENYEKQQKLV